MSANAKDQFPNPDGVKDLPAVPGSLHKTNAPALGPVAPVPDRSTPEQVKGGRS